jgi:hypothetical protein
MKITGLTIWQATHQVLIQQGLLTTGIQADVIASCLFAYFEYGERLSLKLPQKVWAYKTHRWNVRQLQ